MDKHHYFFAVKLPNEAKSFLDKWVQAHKVDYPFGKWVHPEDFHITLAFLGFAEEDKKENAVNSMGEAISGIPSFSLTLNQIGTFGPPKSPRIFWAGVNESDVLKELQKRVYKQCLDIGFQVDKKPFKPHITLARKWKGEQPYEKGRVIPIDTDRPFSFSVDEVVLYETHLDKTPKYKEFARFTLEK